LALVAAILYILAIFPTYSTTKIVDGSAGIIFLNLMAAVPMLVGGVLLVRGVGSPTTGWTFVAASLYVAANQAEDLLSNIQYVHHVGAGLVMQDVAALLGLIAAVVVVLASRGVSDARLHRGWQWRAAIGLAILAGILAALSQLWFQFGDTSSIYSTSDNSNVATTFLAIVLLVVPIAALFVGAGRGACMVAGLAVVFAGEMLGVAWFESVDDSASPHPNAFFWLSMISIVAMVGLAWILGREALARSRADVSAATSS
jgi:hypothetical protein